MVNASWKAHRPVAPAGVQPAYFRKILNTYKFFVYAEFVKHRCYNDKHKGDAVGRLYGDLVISESDTSGDGGRCSSACGKVANSH